jgi:hypothetical protein
MLVEPLSVEPFECRLAAETAPTRNVSERISRLHRVDSVADHSPDRPGKTVSGLPKLMAVSKAAALLIRCTPVNFGLLHSQLMDDLTGDTVIAETVCTHAEPMSSLRLLQVMAQRLIVQVESGAQAHPGQPKTKASGLQFRVLRTALRVPRIAEPADDGLTVGSYRRAARKACLLVRGATGYDYCRVIDVN